LWVKQLNRIIIKKTKEEQKMKTQKLIVMAAIFCLLVGASGAAMAENTCEGGWITGTVEEDVILRGQSQGCTIDNATVNGNVIATGGADVTIQVSNVNGRIRIVDATTAVIFGTTAQNVRIARNTVAVLLSSSREHSGESKRYCTGE
jgi:hypothetical protein